MPDNDTSLDGTLNDRYELTSAHRLQLSVWVKQYALGRARCLVLHFNSSIWKCSWTLSDDIVCNLCSNKTIQFSVCFATLVSLFQVKIAAEFVNLVTGRGLWNYKNDDLVNWVIQSVSPTVEVFFPFVYSYSVKHSFCVTTKLRNKLHDFEVPRSNYS